MLSGFKMYDDFSSLPEPVVQASVASPSIPAVVTGPPATIVSPLSNQSESLVCLTKAEDESACEIIYSDGACKGNGKPGSIAGIGVWWGHNDPRPVSFQLRLQYMLMILSTEILRNDALVLKRIIMLN
jgi:hypothetical protein